MTKKDFELIARAMREGRTYVGTDFAADRESDLHTLCCYRLADALATTNPRFDRAKFLQACGVAS